MPRLASITQQSLLGIGIARGAVNILENGDFRAGDFTGWLIVNDIASSVTNETASVTAGATTTTVTQTVTVEALTGYIVGIDITAFTDAGAADVSFSVSSASDGTIVTVPISNTGSFTSLFYTTDTEVSIVLSITNATVEFDNVTLAEATDQFFYPLTTSTDPTSTSWRTNYAPDSYLFVPNTGIYTETPIVSMRDMFLGNTSFNNGSITDWDTSTVLSMQDMFSQNNTFNQDISSWDTASVTNMAGMFESTNQFNQDISNWTVTNVANMANMFNNADGFQQDISNWNLNSLLNAGSFSTGAALKGTGWTQAEHPQMRMRSQFSNVIGISDSTTTQITCDDTAAGLPGTPFTITGAFSGTTVTVTSVGANDAEQSVLRFASTPDSWFVGEPLLIELYEL